MLSAQDDTRIKYFKTGHLCDIYFVDRSQASHEASPGYVDTFCSAIELRKTLTMPGLFFMKHNLLLIKGAQIYFYLFLKNTFRS